ncbi:YciI family protein [Actinokineospora sp.]|uniref:YciI family protein n=1 Tax=Actinokineospora sp. TaxID=1872133 RepID=UPI0040379CF6
MRYMMLAYTNREAWDAANAEWSATQQMPADVQAACDFFENLVKELGESGEFVSTEGLADPAHAKTVRKADGGPVASDGPFAESKEVLVSFAIVDCESYDRAVEIAARIVDFTGDTVELRPIMDEAGVLEA